VPQSACRGSALLRDDGRTAASKKDENPQRKMRGAVGGLNNWEVIRSGDEKNVAVCAKEKINLEKGVAPRRKEKNCRKKKSGGRGETKDPSKKDRR